MSSASESVHSSPLPCRHRRSLIVILLVYLALTIAYTLNSPLYEPTDELRHVRYVRHIAVYHELPVQHAEGPRAQSHHPPLYYALAALVSGWIPVQQEVYYQPPANPYWGYHYWQIGDDNKNQYLHDESERYPFRGITLAVYVVRGLTILIGAGVVYLTYRIGAEIFPTKPLLAAAGTALLAFNSQFIYLSGAVNNDVPAALCGAAILLACLRLIRRGPGIRLDVTLGILYGLSLLTKFHLLALLVPIGLAYLVAVWQVSSTGSHRWYTALTRAIAGLLVVVGFAALISGWWFWRNYALYGDPTGMSKVNELWAGRPASENWWAIRQSLPYLWSSLWGRFGYGQIPMPRAVYDAVLILCGLSLAGYLIPRRPHRSRTTLLLLAAFPMTFLAVVCFYILIQPAGAMGRFLFPALPAFTLLVAYGLNRLLARPLKWAVNFITAIGMLALAIYALFGVLRPAFARPRPLTVPETEDIPNTSAGVRFGDVAQLLGYHVAPTTVQPGDTIDVTVYWQALTSADQNYAVFVHLLSEPGDILIAQRDTYPGLGRYPTSVWRPGVIFADTYRIFVPPMAYTPDRGYVQVGVYLPGESRLTTSDGRDALRLNTIEIETPVGEVPNSVQANFDDQITLVGYSLDRRVVRPGETIRLTLLWQAQTPLERDYRVFAHVLGVENQVWANADSQPVPPTSQWQPGQIVEDVRDLTLGQTTPPDFYDIEVGIYDPDDGRLPVVAPDGRWLDKRVLLSKIRAVDHPSQGVE